VYGISSHPFALGMFYVPFPYHVLPMVFLLRHFLRPVIISGQHFEDLPSWQGAVRASNKTLFPSAPFFSAFCGIADSLHDFPGGFFDLLLFPFFARRSPPPYLHSFSSGVCQDPLKSFMRWRRAFVRCSRNLMHCDCLFKNSHLSFLYSSLFFPSRFVFL